MDDTPHPALLPAGLRDLLPPPAESEAASVERIMSVFAAHAYRRVEPPLLEYEDSFLRGAGAAVAEQSFRIMDPDSHRMMVLRPDMTPQIARIAATRLAEVPRPLRLSYAGQCVRVTGNGPSTGAAADRQVPQAGIELIGADSAAADAEIMLVAVEALAALGLTRLSLDLTLPTLVPMLLDQAGFAPDTRSALSHALDRKDAAAVTAHGGTLAPMLTDLLMAAGLLVTVAANAPGQLSLDSVVALTEARSNVRQTWAPAARRNARLAVEPWTSTESPSRA